MTPTTHLRLDNVTVIRNILIVLLVFYHAFAIYSGAWTPIDGYPEVPAYWWLDKLSYAFMLEMFVFISGYVFGFQVRTKGDEKLKTKNLLWGKFKRLMIPCVVFSLLYILLFRDIRQHFYITAYDLLNGIGHMWFLPMLFWCFVGIWVIEKLHLRPKFVIPLLCLASICSYLPLPFQLTASMYYMLFFYVGYILQKEDISFERFYTLKHSLLTLILFCVLFPSFTLLKEHLVNVMSDVYNVCVCGGGYLIDNQLITKALILSVSKLLQIIYALAGMAMLFVYIGYKEKERKGAVSQWLIRLGGLCFGVYLLQQFILKGLYYYTDLPAILGCYWLPWVGFVVTLISSVLIAFLMVKTKIGRILIG